MGDASYVLKGRGSLASLCSAPHGAGRLAARGAGRRAFTDEMQSLRVVTKIDLATVRQDIANEYRRDLMEWRLRNTNRSCRSSKPWMVPALLRQLLDCVRS